MKPKQPALSHKRTLVWRDLAAVLLLCALSIALYRKVALTNRILAGTDAMTYFYPYRAYAAQAICDGRIPLWNPYLFLGVPFLANPQAAVFYPPNMVLCGLSAPKQVAWSLVIHSALAAVLAYLYARRVLSLLPAAAGLAAAAFGQGGYLAAQAEHINQVNVLAWFPLLLLLWELRRRARWLSLLGLALVIGLGFLAGHTQASFISLVGLGLYAVASTSVRKSDRAQGMLSVVRAWLRSLVGVTWQLAFVVLVAFGLSAVQMLPTLELSGLSIRAGGFDYRQAVAFSLKPIPRLLRYTFLPQLKGRAANLGVLFGGDYYTEYVAYIGFLGLLLALWACVAWVRGLVQFWWPRRFDDGHGSLGGLGLYEEKSVFSLILLAGVGLLLALGLYNPLYWIFYKLVPGFSLFRAPARWLFLYAFAAAMLSGVGLQHVRTGLLCRSTRIAAILTLLLAAIGAAELLIAARVLPLNQPTAPESFSSLRTAPAHLRAAQAQALLPGRFLSMSDTLFDPGDLGELQQLYRDQLQPEALYGHIVNVKRQEILAPNLPLGWRIYAIDGYDGGVLPLTRYVHLQRLLLEESDILADGRIREGLDSIPTSRVLSILGAEYVLTDKVHDVWIDDVFYDLSFETILAAQASASDRAVRSVHATASDGAPYHTATALGIVSHLQDADQLPQGTPVALVVVTMRNRAAPGTLARRTFELLAGRDTAEGLYLHAAHKQAEIGRQWHTGADPMQTGYDYVAQLSWETPQDIEQVEIKALPFQGKLLVRGLALIDQRDQSSVPLLLHSRGRFTQVHSGDVKLYQALDALPRAYVVHRARVVEDDLQAVAILSDPAFDPSQTVLLHPDSMQVRSPLPLGDSGELDVVSYVTVESYRPQEIVLQVHMGQPGYVVLSDSWYPGWQALLDNEPVPIERANIAFRAVHVPQGSHNLHMAYRPASYAWGLGISLGTLLILLLASITSAQQIMRAFSSQRPHSTGRQLDGPLTLEYNAGETKEREVEI